MGIEIKSRGMAGLMARLRVLTRKEALVGIMGGSSTPQGEPGAPRTMAEIGYIREFGSSIRGAGGGAEAVAPFPHLRAGIEAAKREIAAALASGVRGTLAGRLDAADAALRMAGQIGQDAVQAKLDTAAFNPPSPPDRAGTGARSAPELHREHITSVVRQKGGD